MPRMLLTLVLLPACTAKSACDAGESLVDGACVPEETTGCTAVADANVVLTPGTDGLGAALAAAVDGDVIGLEPGVYVESETLVVPAGVHVAGSCAAEVTVQRGSDDPGFEVEDADGVWITGLTLEGGAPGLALTAAAPVTVTLADVAVRSAGSYGVYVAGSVSLEASDLVVTDTIVAGDGSLGRGLSAQAGAAVTLRGGRFERTAEVGIFADAAALDLEGVTVSNTQATALGLYGRGIHVQHSAALLATTLTLQDNREHGLCVLDSDATVSASTISGTQLADLADGSGQAGDAVAVFLGQESSTPTGTVSLSGLDLSGNARAGLLVDAYPVTVSGLSFSGNGYSWVTQNGASLSGIEGSAVDDGEGALEDLSGADVLSIYDEPME